VASHRPREKERSRFCAALGLFLFWLLRRHDLLKLRNDRQGSASGGVYLWLNDHRLRKFASAR
jgi:hypothetical protein